jgi:hypothetical protein
MYHFLFKKCICKNNFIKKFILLFISQSTLMKKSLLIAIFVSASFFSNALNAQIGVAPGISFLQPISKSGLARAVGLNLSFYEYLTERIRMTESLEAAMTLQSEYSGNGVFGATTHCNYDLRGQFGQWRNDFYLIAGGGLLVTNDYWNDVEVGFTFDLGTGIERPIRNGLIFVEAMLRLPDGTYRSRIGTDAPYPFTLGLDLGMRFNVFGSRPLFM